MPLSVYLGGGLGVALLLLLGSCGRMNDLREEIGEERQRCETSLQQLRADKLEALNAAERAAERERALTVAALNALLIEQQEELYRLQERDRELTRTLTATMRRIDQEDREWGDMPVPSYLLQD